MSEIESSTIRYSAKELFAQINNKLDVITDALSTKADHDALVVLESRVTALEATENRRQGFTSGQKAIVPLLVAIATLLAPIAYHYLP